MLSVREVRVQKNQPVEEVSLGMSFWNLSHRAACEFTKSRTAHQGGQKLPPSKSTGIPGCFNDFPHIETGSKLEVDSTVEWLVLQPRRFSTLSTSPFHFKAQAHIKTSASMFLYNGGTMSSRMLMVL